jgi:capsular exopolysaccharide synthesis family protein
MDPDAAAPAAASGARADKAGSSEGGLELQDLLRILSERRYIILGAAALGVVLAIIISLLMTPLYRATALLELNSPATQFAEEASGGAARGAPNVDSQEMLATQLGLLRSDTLARRVAQDLNLPSRPEFGGVAGTRQQRLDSAVAVLQNNTLIEAVKGSMLIKVSHSSPDQVLAARIANAISQGFIASSLERRYDSSSYARDFLRNQLTTTKAALEQSERQLNDYAIQSGIFRTPGQIQDGVVTQGASLAANNLTSLNEALNQAKVRRITAEQAYRNAAGQMGSTQAASGSGLREQRAILQAEYDDKARLFKEDYPEMRQLAARIATLDRASASERSIATGGKRGDLLAEYRSAQEAENQLARQVSLFKGDVQSERSRSIQYNILQREVDTNRSLYDALLQRYKEIGVAGGIGQSNVSLVDDAKPPQSPFRPNLPLNVAIGLLAGLVIGIGSALVAHLLFDNIVYPADVRNKLGLPVLGSIPVESEGRSLFDALADRKSEISEAYYSVRTALRFADAEGTPGSLLVTSSRPGEGKSTSAFAIASSFARNGEKVLLIDADLRKPTFLSHRRDGLGFAHLLGSEDPISGVVEPTKVENLSLIPVGRYHGSAAELLSSTRLRYIVEEARREYSMVVLDGPPVLGLADVPLLAAVAEKTVIVVESREARTASVQEMVRRLTTSGAAIAGVILTKVRGGSGYGYEYYSYRYGDDVGGKVSRDPDRVLAVGADSAPTP